MTLNNKENSKKNDDDQDKNFNVISVYIDEVLGKYPYKLGVVYPHCQDKVDRYAYTHLNYQQVGEELWRHYHGFKEREIGPGTKVLLLVPPCLEFTTLFAVLMTMGAIPILIDPGMGIRPMLKSIRSVKPDVFMGIPLAQLARVFGKRYFKSVKLSITVGGRRWFWRGPKFIHLRSDNAEPDQIYKAKKDDIAGIFFTTGSTGIPKGVIYTHGMMIALTKSVADFFKFDSSTIEMPAFPPFALFCLAYGGTSVIPEMDPTRPARADPEKLIRFINDFGVNVSYGSPSIWSSVSRYCIKNNVTLPSLNRLFLFGAPVSGEILERYQKIMPNGETYTPYGATEAIFISTITGSEACAETFPLTKQGKGVCVGYVIKDVEVKIIKITDEKIEVPEGGFDELTVPQGTIGEIAVRGDYVSSEYYMMPEQTAKAKIYDKDTIWHRMGDLGYLDEKKRLWIVGRKSHRVKRDGKEYYTVMIEAFFNFLDGIIRSAMVGVPDSKIGQRMVIIIQLEKKNLPNELKKKKLRETYLFSIAKKANILVDAFLFRGKIPVDIRHNAKIKRDLLALWAEKKLKGRFD